MQRDASQNLGPNFGPKFMSGLLLLTFVWLTSSTKAQTASETETPTAPALPVTECTQQFLQQELSVSGNAVCARNLDEAQEHEMRIVQSVMRNATMDFDNLTLKAERRCDCEFAYGRYDMTPRRSIVDGNGWWRALCRKFVSTDGKNCGSEWYQSDEGFRPQLCDPKNPKHLSCIEGSFVSELRDPESQKRKLVPVTVCARKEGTKNPNGTPVKDSLIMIVDAQIIPKYKKHIHSCINVKIVKDSATKKIFFSATAPNHPLIEVRNQELLRGEIIRGQ